LNLWLIFVWDLEGRLLLEPVLAAGRYLAANTLEQLVFGLALPDTFNDGFWPLQYRKVTVHVSVMDTLR